MGALRFGTLTLWDAPLWDAGPPYFVTGGELWDAPLLGQFINYCR